MGDGIERSDKKELEKSIPITKVLILGVTGAGKSTIAGTVARELNLRPIEVDDEVIQLNGGIWPSDEGIIDDYMHRTNAEVLTRDNVLFATSWLSKEDIQRFHQSGFVIVELHADQNELLRRKIKRDNPDQEHIDRFHQNLPGYYEVVQDPAVQLLIGISIDTTNTDPGNVKQRVLDFLNKSASQ